MSKSSLIMLSVSMYLKITLELLKGVYNAVYWSLVGHRSMQT